MASIQKRPGSALPYRVMWREGGRQRSKSFARLNDARRFRAGLELHDEAVSVGTCDVDAAFTEFLRDRLAVCQPRTVERYLTVRNAFVPVIGNRRLDDLTADDIAQWRNDRRARCAAKTVRCDLVCLRAFFNWAVRRGYIKASPAADVALPTVKRGVPGWLDADQTAALLAELAADWEWEIRLVCLLAVRAGLRRNEILTLRWADIDFTERVLRVRGKSRSVRLVPMHPDIEQALMDWPERGPWVFWRQRDRGGNRLRSSAQGKVVNRWLRNHGYGITLHGLRHSFASQLAANGASENEIRDLLGHTSMAVTRVYTHSRDTAKRQHVAQLGCQTPTRATSSGRAAPRGTVTAPAQATS